MSKKFLASLAFAAAVIAASSAWSATRVVVALALPADSADGRASDLLKSKAAEYSKGSLDVEVFAGGQLGSFGDTVTQMKVGAVNLIFIQPDALGGQVPIATANAWPFLFKNADDMIKAWNGPGGQALTAEVEKRSGYRMLFPTWNSPRVVFSNRPVKSLADLKGLKIRVPGLPVYVGQMRLLGLVPTPFDLNQLYTGMQTNAVGGAEFALTDGASLSMQDVSKAVVATNHVLSPKVWLAWGQWVDQLSPSDKDALYRALKDASDYYGKAIEAEAQKDHTAFVAKGVAFVDSGVSAEELQKTVEPLKTQLPEIWTWAQTLRDGKTQ